MWPKGGRVSPKTIHIANYEPSEATMWWVEKMMVFASEMLLAYLPEYVRIPLSLVSPVLVFRSEYLRRIPYGKLWEWIGRQDIVVLLYEIE